VIQTWSWRGKTCGQLSGMAAVSKRRAIAFYFSVRNCYMFLMSKCREEWDLVLCMTLVLVTRMPLRSADFRRILRPNTFKNRALDWLLQPILLDPTTSSCLFVCSSFVLTLFIFKAPNYVLARTLTSCCFFVFCFLVYFSSTFASPWQNSFVQSKKKWTTPQKYPRMT